MLMANICLQGAGSAGVHPDADTIARVLPGQPQAEVVQVEPVAAAAGPTAAAATARMLAAKCVQAEVAALRREMVKLSQQAERSTAAAAWALDTASGETAMVSRPAETATLILPALDYLLQVAMGREHASVCQPNRWGCLELELWACAE